MTRQALRQNWPQKCTYDGYKHNEITTNLLNAYLIADTLVLCLKRKSPKILQTS